ncbi:urea amidolyase associated protein UAAP1 [Kineosporia sp. A_224]|uniref:urea amidolyase associated protein UAAP1 n=1 Tax=Kineosporia sp. A_224 TaxID=1962180 RepID=UPI000B4B77BD|nr:urea amidolyase associated protein UAAP1 [Kineosporia sp. A_224]
MTATGSATASTYGARDHARAQAGTVVTTMPVLPASGWPSPPDGVTPADLVWAETVAGGNYTHLRVARGTHVRFTDVEGSACAHLALHNATQPWERLNVADTTKVAWQAYLGAGALLLSDQGRVLASVVEDTSGRHDAFCGTSTLVSNAAKYGDGAPQGPSPAGRELLVLAAAKQGLLPRDLPTTLSFFQGVDVGPDGGLTFTGSAGPGASVTLRAELPLVVLVANVPHPVDPRPQYTSTPLEVVAWRGAATTPRDALWSATPEGERAFLNSAAHAAMLGLDGGTRA